MERSAPRPARTRPRHRSWLRRVCVGAAWLLGGLLALAAVLYGLRGPVLAPIAVSRASAWLEREHGLVLTVDRVGGDWYSELAASGVTLRTADGAARPWSLRVDEVSARYDLLAAWRGAPGWFERLDASGVGLRADLSAPAAPSDPAGAPDAAPLALPAWLPAVSVSGVDVELELPDERSLALRGAGLRHDAGRLAAEVPQLALGGPWPLLPREFALRAEARLSGQQMDFSRLEVSGGIEARTRTARLQLAPERVALALELEAAHGVARIDAESTGGEWSAEWSVAGLALAELARVSPATVELGLDGRLSAAGSAVLAGGGLWTSASGTLTGLCAAGRSVDELGFELILRPGFLELARLDVRQSSNFAWARGLSVPLSGASGLDVLRAVRGEVEVAVHDLTELSGSTAAVPPHRLVLAGVLDERGIELRRGRLLTHSGTFEAARGRVTWSAPGEPLLSSSSFDIDTTAAFDDLAELGSLFDDRRWAGQLAGTMHVSGTLREPFGDLDLLGRDVIASGFELGELAARARTDGRWLDVGTLRASGALGELDLDGRYDLSEQRFERSRWRVSLSRLDALAPQWFESGLLELRAELSGPLRAPRGTFEASVADLALIGQPPIASARLAGELRADAVRLDSIELAVAGVDVRAAGQLVHGAWQPPYLLELERASIVHEGLALALERPCALEFGPRRTLLEAIAFSGAQGRLEGSFALAGSDWKLSARADGIDAQPLAAPFLPAGVSFGVADGRLDVERTAGRYALSADLRLARLVLAPDVPPFALEFSGRAAGERASVAKLALVSDQGLKAELQGELPFDSAEPWKLRDGALQLSASASVERASALPLARLGLPGRYDGALTARCVLAGQPPDLRGLLEVDGRGLTLAPGEDAGVLSELRLDGADFGLRALLDGALTLERCTLRAGPRLDVAFEGCALGPEGARALFSAPRAALDAPGLDLRGRWTIEDSSFLSVLFASLRRVAGATSGEVALRGTWRAPDAHGALRLSGGELRFETGLPALEALEGTALFDGTALRIERLTGELGAGPFTLAGSVELGGAEPSFDLQLQGRELLLVRQRELRLRADADLALRGPLSALVLSGELATRDSRWTRNFDWFQPRGRSSPGVSREAGPPLFSIASGPLADLRFDLRLRGGDLFRVETNVVRGALRPDLTLRGTGRAPELGGALFLEETRVFLPAANLELRSGSLTIDRREPLDPRLDVVLSARVRGYDVTIQLSGTASAPEVELSSLPPLSSEEVLMLVLTGRAPGGSLAGDEGTEAAEAVIVYLGRDLLGRVLESGGEAEMLERLEWQTGADVTRYGGSTAQVSIRVSGKSEGQGRAIYVRGERDIYDRINYGLRFVVRLR